MGDDTALIYSGVYLSALKQPGLRGEDHVVVERINGAVAADVAQAGEVGARGSGRVDVDQSRTPVAVHVPLAMGRLDDYEIEVPRIQPMGEKEGTIEEMHGPAGEDQGKVLGLNHGRGAGI